jgi:hypothetical protein
MNSLVSGDETETDTAGIKYKAIRLRWDGDKGCDAYLAYELNMALQMGIVRLLDPFMDLELVLLCDDQHRRD